MPTLISSKPNRKASARRPSRTAARRPSGAKMSTAKARKGASAPAPAAPPKLSEQVPANDMPPTNQGGELQALVTALLAFVASWRPRLTDPVALVVLRGVEALLGQVAKFTGAKDGGWLLAHTAGPVAGLRFTADDPENDSTRARRGVDELLAELCDDLSLVLDHHDPAVLDSRNGLALHSAVGELVGLAHECLQKPGDCPELEAGVRGRAPQQHRSSEPVALEPAHQKMLIVADSLLNYVSDIGEAFADVRGSVDDLLDRNSPTTRRGRIENLRSDLTKLDRILRSHELRVIEFGEKLTGTPSHLGRAAVMSRVESVFQATRNCDPKFLVHERNLMLSDARKAFSGNH